MRQAHVRNVVRQACPLRQAVAMPALWPGHSYNRTCRGRQQPCRHPAARPATGQGDARSAQACASSLTSCPGAVSPQARGELAEAAAQRDRLSEELAARGAELASARKRASAPLPQADDESWLVSASFGDAR